MALSLRQKQLDVIVRMLHLYQQQQQQNTPGSGGEQDEDEAYKILVMDAPCVSLLSPVLRVGDLRRHGVTLTLSIDRARQAVPDAPAVYLVRPTPSNADRIAADAAAGLYASFHINFSTSVPRPVLERLAAACAASPGSSRRVARVADQYLDFVCLEEGLFSLAQPRAYIALNDPAAADADIAALVDAVALGLFCVAATLGAVPVIRCARGGPAEMVAAALDDRLRDHLLAKPNLFTEAASAAVASFQRPVLCLFDRNFELSVGVQHDWSYRPLVHDVLGLKLNKLKLPAEKYDLDDSDKFWVANSWSQFPKLAEEIEAQLAKYKQDVDEVNQRTGGGKVGVEFDGTDLIGNTKHLMNAVNSLPELTERKKMIDKHTNIATALLGHIKERSLDGYCDCENDMLVNGTVDRNTLLSLLRGKGTKEDKLRLAVTYLLSFETPPSSELEQVEAVLHESEVDMSAFQYVKRIKALNTQFSTASGTATKSNIVDWAEKLYGQSLSAVTAGVKNLLSDGRQLALTRTVEALMEGKPNPEVDDYLLFDPRVPRSGTGGQFKGPFREAIVFMIGGGNYIEYRSLMELEQRSQPSKHVIYGATEILSGAEFIHQLAELGQKAGLGGGSSNAPPGPAQ